MDFYNKIKNRTSVREYDQNKQIGEQELQKILEVINSAPTSSNWHSSSVIVVRDKELLHKLGQSNKYTGAITSCDTFLVFLADYNRMNLAKEMFPELLYNSHSSESYTVGVGDAFIQATMAQDIAKDLGISSCFLGLVRMMESDLIETLNIKGQAFPVIGLTLGYAKEENNLVKPKMNRIFMNQYNIERLKTDTEEYNKPLEEYFASVAPGRKFYTYKEATIRSASGYRMETKLIEDIWKLVLEK